MINISHKQKKYFELAKRLSRKSDHHKFKLGCVIVNGRQIVGLGYNQLKSHTKSPHVWKRVHSEFHAILGVLPADLKGAEVYVYRETKNGDPAIAKPCPVCEKMLCDCGIRHVYFSIKGGFDRYSFY